MTTTYQSKIVDGFEIFHTHRGHNNEIDVYTYQDGPRTYSLYKKKGDNHWACDWTASYNRQVLELNADPANEAAMLKAFVDMLR